MIRLLDLHAASCAGDTLVTMGLARPIFFNVPVGEARGRVALYLLITMAPFACWRRWLGRFWTGSATVAGMRWRSRCSAGRSWPG